MADQIEINYDQMNTVKGKFSDNAQQIEQLKQKLQGHVDDLRAGGFLGRGATAFYSEMDQYIFPVITRLSQALVQAESSCQQIATEFETAEDEAQKFVDFTIE